MTLTNGMDTSMSSASVAFFYQFAVTFLNTGNLSYILYDYLGCNLAFHILAIS